MTLSLSLSLSLSLPPNINEERLVMANMKKRITASLIGAAMAVSMGLVSASPAEATYRVNCGTRTDWLILYSEATTCWATSGTVSGITLYRVKVAWGGNNAGYVTDTAGNRLTFYKNSISAAINSSFPTIKSITINP